MTFDPIAAPADTQAICSCGKQIYPTKADARRAVRSQPDHSLKIYRCNLGADWYHVGHRRGSR